MIRSCILQIYSSHDSRPGTYKIQKLLASEFCIHISAGRVYRLMKDMKLPSFRAKKPCFVYADLSFEAQNLLKQNFTQKAPDLVWCSDITYLKVQNKFYYLCVIIDLFSRKIVAYRLSSKIDAKLVTDTFLDAYEKENIRKDLCSIRTEARSTRRRLSVRYWIIAEWYNLFRRKVILMITPWRNAFSSTLKKKKPTGAITRHSKIFGFPYSNT